MALHSSLARLVEQANLHYIPIASKIGRRYSVVLKIQYFHIHRIYTSIRKKEREKQNNGRKTTTTDYTKKLKESGTE